MTYEDACKEMERLAEGKAWALMTESASYHMFQVHGYIAGPIGHADVAPTYAGAVDNVRRALIDRISPGVLSDKGPKKGEDHEAGN